MWSLQNHCPDRRRDDSLANTVPPARRVAARRNCGGDVAHAMLKESGRKAICLAPVATRGSKGGRYTLCTTRFAAPDGQSKLETTPRSTKLFSSVKSGASGRNRC